MDDIVLLAYVGAVALLCVKELIVAGLVVAMLGWLGLCWYAWLRSRKR